MVIVAAVLYWLLQYDWSKVVRTTRQLDGNAVPVERVSCTLSAYSINRLIINPTLSIATNNLL